MKKICTGFIIAIMMGVPATAFAGPVQQTAVNGAAIVIQGETAAAANTEQNSFRNLNVTGEGGHYRISGEMQTGKYLPGYAVSDGHRYLIKGSIDVQTETDMSGWTPFNLEIELMPEQLPFNGTLSLELFLTDAKGERIVETGRLLETFQRYGLID